jgi:hypothetical protein
MEQAGVGRLQQAFEELKDAKCMIIDVRGNGGGSDWLCSYFASHFIQGPFPLYVIRNRRGDYFENPKRIPASYRAFEGKRFERPVYVLVDNCSFSATDTFLFALHSHIPERVNGTDLMEALFARAGTPIIDPNILAIRIQPDEGILLRFGAKVPGQGLQIRSVNMDFRYGSSFAVDSPDAYETLILDCMIGDPSLFTRNDEVERAWEILQPVLEAWHDGDGGYRGEPRWQERRRL